jgi:hypothetical protein
MPDPAPVTQAIFPSKRFTCPSPINSAYL